MSKLRDITAKYVEGSQSMASMEKGYMSQVLSLCLGLLQFVISAKLSTLKELGAPTIEQGQKLRHKGKRYRKYLSLFGMLEFERPAYCCSSSGMIYPLDEALRLPNRLWSYNIQELTAQGATETDFRESVALLNQLLGLGLSDTGSERNVSVLGQSVDAFYKQRAVDRVPDQACFCASFDGKGVPKIKPRDRKAEPPSAKLSKGQKRGIKQMATVAVMSWMEPVKRDKSSIIKALMRDYDKTKALSQGNDNRRHQAIHRRAFLADQDKAIAYGLGHIKAQIHHPDQRLVVPIDAGIGLEDKVLHYVKEYGLEAHFDGIILDFIHVSEYVWECANAVLGEQSVLRNDWVRDMLSDLLDSKTQKVIKDLKQIVDKSQSLTPARKDKIAKAITYFTNHAHKMDYRAYLDKGYPITSALVEANCKHLVKDRMEQSGMRWSTQGAQAMMDLRAVKLNGQLAEMMEFVDQQQRKNYLLQAA